MSRQASLRATPDIHGVPLYPIPFAARYLDIPASTLGHWVTGWTWEKRDGSAGVAPPIIEVPDSRVRNLSFTNLIEAHVLRFLRTVGRQTMRGVREGVDRLKKRYGAQHPLATFEFKADPHGREFLIQGINPGELENVSSPGQHLLSFVENSLERVSYESQGAAIAVYPFPRGSWAAAAARPVIFDIRKSCGEPLISGTRVPVEPVLSRFLGGETVPSLADDFEIEPERIEAVLRWKIGNLAA